MTRSKRAPGVPAFWQKYIHHVARSAAIGMLSVEDARSTAYVAFVKANRQYNPRKGPFEHYAKAAIRKALITARTHEQRHFEHRAEFPDDELRGIVSLPPWAEEEDRLDELQAKRNAEIIGAWIGRLPSKLVKIWEALYRDDLSQRAAAERFGLSQPRISQLNNQLLAIAKQDLAALA